MSLRLAVATEDFGASLRRAIVQAAKAQVRGIRLNARTEVNPKHTTDSALRQLAHYVGEQQMQIAGLICPTKHALSDPEFLEERLDLIRRAMALARKLNTVELLIRCGRIPDPETSEEREPLPSNSDVESLANPFSFAGSTGRSTKTVASSSQKFAMLSEIVSDLARHGNHVGCVPHLQFAAYDVALIRKLLASVNTGPVAIAFDPATAVMTGSDVVTAFRDLYNDVGYIRARDAIRDVDGAGVEVPVGDGNVDWTEFLPTLAEADFSGWVCVERTGGDDRANDVLAGVARMKKLIPQAGS
ncbi:MAG: sugar phosphate isomerase/epimerase [Planctomycetaceae bacterium]